MKIPDAIPETVTDEWMDEHSEWIDSKLEEWAKADSEIESWELEGVSQR